MEPINQKFESYFNCNWDVNKYRSSHESDEQWNLKKKFILQNKNKCSEEQLICYAQVLSNMEFLGCRYPDETVKAVKELSGNLLESFNDIRRYSIKRTFISASDAAESKFCAKKIKPAKSTTNIESMIPSQVSHKNTETISNENDISNLFDTGLDVFPDQESIAKLSLNFPNFIRENLILFKSPSEIDNPYQTISRSATSSRQESHIKVEPIGDEYHCNIYIGEYLISSQKDKSIKGAKRLASLAAIEILEKHCMTIKVKSVINSEGTIERAGFNKVSDKKPSEIGTKEMPFGMKLLQSMGWQGGGLGKNENGITKPITPSMINNREGLGHKKDLSTIFRKNFSELIHSFLSTDLSTDLKFSPDFTLEERKFMHQILHKYNLKSKSYGRGTDRYLVVSKKLDPRDLVKHLQSLGGSSDKYELIYPNS